MGKESEGRLLGFGDWCLGFPAKVTRENRDSGSRVVGIVTVHRAGREFRFRHVVVILWLFGCVGLDL